MRQSSLVYLLRRVLFAIPTVIGISFFTFILLGAWLNPLWRIGVFNCPKHGYTRDCTPGYLRLIDAYHLNQHLVPRWWFWAKGVFTGASSYPAVPTNPNGRVDVYRLPQYKIWPQVWTALEHTAVLIALAMVVVIVLSLALGILAARRPGTARDVTVRTVAYSTWSVPAFLLALLLQELFVRLAIAYGWRPVYLQGIPGSEAGTGFHFVLDWLQHLALPVIALAVGFIGAYSRYVRSAMLVSLNAPYVVAARAKGMSETRLTLLHALRNSMIPFVNVLALDFGAIFGASLAVDWVFKLHGIASYLAQGLFDSDPYEVEPVVLVAAGFVLLSRVVADALTTRLDPRVRLA